MRYNQSKSGSGFWVKAILLAIVVIVVYRCSTSKIDQPDSYNTTSSNASVLLADYSELGMLDLNKLSRAERKNYTGKGEFEFLFKSKRYRGDWIDGQPSGNGEMWHSNGDYAIGEFRNGMLEGEAVKKYVSGSTYSGSFSKNKRQGFGKLIYPNGVVQEGHWDNDRFMGVLQRY